MAVGLEDETLSDLYRVVGETLIEPADQGHVNASGDVVAPSWVNQHGQQLAVQFADRAVAASQINLAAPSGFDGASYGPSQA